VKVSSTTFRKIIKESILKEYGLLNEIEPGIIDPTEQGGGTGTTSVKQGQMSSGRKPEVKGEDPLGGPQSGKSLSRILYDKINDFLKGRTQHNAYMSLSGQDLTMLLLKNLPTYSNDTTRVPFNDEGVEISWTLKSSGALKVNIELDTIEGFPKFKYSYEAEDLLTKLASGSGFELFVEDIVEDTLEELEDFSGNIFVTIGGAIGDFVGAGSKLPPPDEVASQLRDVLSSNKSQIIGGVGDMFDRIKDFLRDNPIVIYAVFVLKRQSESLMSELGPISKYLFEDAIQEMVADEIHEGIVDAMEDADAYSLLGQAIAEARSSIESSTYGSEDGDQIEEAIKEFYPGVSKKKLLEIIREQLEIGFRKTSGGYEMYDPSPNDSSTTTSAYPLNNPEIRLRIEEYLGLDTKKDIDRFLRIHDEPLSIILWHAEKQGEELLSAWDNVKDYIDTMSRKNMLMKNRPNRQRRAAKEIINEDADRDSELQDDIIGEPPGMPEPTA
jgi:hypothetical protein